MNTSSLSPIAPALIVTHGQPSDPAPAAQALAQLAAQVAARSGGRRVASATLAENGALEAALAHMGARGLVYPMFMAGGWFTRVALAERLRKAGASLGQDGWQVLEPFGCQPAVHDLARDVLAEAMGRAQRVGKASHRAQVLIAAHGSFKSSAPSDVARALAAKLRRDLGLARCEAAFIDQAPRLQDVAGYEAGALCLPFFAAQGGHVTEDIPRALKTARFTGLVLPPLGLDFRVPSIIAAALDRPEMVCAQNCRYAQA